jgi:hypothetical protein
MLTYAAYKGIVGCDNRMYIPIRMLCIRMLTCAAYKGIVGCDNRTCILDLWRSSDVCWRMLS